MRTIKIEDIFDEIGNFINPIDPYRCDRDNEVYQYLSMKMGMLYVIKKQMSLYQSITVAHFLI